VGGLELENELKRDPVGEPRWDAPIAHRARDTITEQPFRLAESSERHPRPSYGLEEERRACSRRHLGRLGSRRRS